MEQDLGYLYCDSFPFSFFFEFKFLDELTHAPLGCETNSTFERHEEDENFRSSDLSLLDEGTKLLCVFSSRTRVLVFSCVLSAQFLLLFASSTSLCFCFSMLLCPFLFSSPPPQP